MTFSRARNVYVSRSGVLTRGTDDDYDAYGTHTCLRLDGSVVANWHKRVIFLRFFIARFTTVCPLPIPLGLSTVIVFSVKFFIHSFPPSAPRRRYSNRGETANPDGHSRLSPYFFFELLRSMKRTYAQHALVMLAVFDFRSSSTNVFPSCLLFGENSRRLLRTKPRPVRSFINRTVRRVSLAFHSRGTYLYSLCYTFPAPFYLPLFCALAAFRP